MPNRVFIWPFFALFSVLNACFLCPYCNILYWKIKIIISYIYNIFLIYSRYKIIYTFEEKICKTTLLKYSLLPILSQYIYILVKKRDWAIFDQKTLKKWPGKNTLLTLLLFWLSKSAITSTGQWSIFEARKKNYF